LPLDKISKVDANQRFLEKTKSWFSGIPAEVIEEYKIDQLLTIVENGYKILETNQGTAISRLGTCFCSRVEKLAYSMGNMPWQEE